VYDQVKSDTQIIGKTKKASTIPPPTLDIDPAIDLMTRTIPATAVKPMLM
jgi:hypothetical protein